MLFIIFMYTDMHMMSGHSEWEQYLPVVGRALLALIFIIAGTMKIFGFAGTVGYIASVGLPMPEVVAVLTIVLEVGAGLALLVGFHARTAAWVLALFTLLATVLFHRNLADQMQMTLALKNLAMLGGLLYVAKYGAGAWSMGNSGCSCCGNSCGSCGGGTCAPAA